MSGFDLIRWDSFPTAEYAIANGVTLSPGEIVKYSAGRVDTAATAGRDWYGICVAGGTGNAGGTVLAAVRLFSSTPALVVDYATTVNPGDYLDLATGALGLTTGSNHDVLVVSQSGTKVVCLPAPSTLLVNGFAPLLAHTHSGTTDGAKLAQANTHQSADTDTATSALHHTLGTGANNAAAGSDGRFPTSDEKAGLSGLTAANAAVTAAQTDARVVADANRPTNDQKGALAGLGTPTALNPYLTAGGMFVSAEQTGTGVAQNVAHGLGRTPTLVLIAVTEVPDAGGALTGAGIPYDVAEGVHDETNVVATVTANVKFKVLAL